MNKCLVTTLKAHTNNEALSKYNVLTIKIKTIDSPTMNTQWIGFGASENGSVSINSQSVGLYKTGISGELHPYPYTVPANTYKETHFENKDGIIEVTGKYNLNRLIVGKAGIVRIKEIYGIPATLDRLIINSIEEEEIDVAKLCNSINRSKFKQLDCPSSKFVNKLNKDAVKEFLSIENADKSFNSMFDDLNVDNLVNNISIKLIEFVSLKAGNLSSLAKLTNLTTLIFSDSQQNSGDIMDFINPWIQAGRTSGKIEVNWLLGQKNITLNGSPISYPSGVPNLGSYLNWTSDGTVTFTAS